MKRWKAVALSFFGLSIISAIIQSEKEKDPAFTKARYEAKIAAAYASERSNWSATTDEASFGLRSIGGFGDGVRADKIKEAVARRLKDPDSAKFGDIYAVGDKKIGGKYIVHICGHVNAKNAFGGYVGNRAFLIRMDTMELRMADGTGSTANAVIRDYNAICAGDHKDPTIEQQTAWLEKNGKLPR